MKIKVILISFVISVSVLFAEPTLEGFLKNDLELKKLTLEVDKALISSKNTNYENGFNVVLSSGEAKFSTVNDNFTVSFTPKATVSVPQASNLGFSVSSSMKFVNGIDKSGNTKFSISADILSGTGFSRKLKLMACERNLLAAKRNLQNRALEAEKEYYSNLKKLFESASSIVQLQKTMYDDKIDFEEIKAKGYSSGSSKYRQAELKVLSDNHDIETKIRELEHDCAVFAVKCGADYENVKNPKEFLPSSIQKVEPIDVLSFEKNTYKKIEEANYNHEYKVLERKADKNFTLTASGGYTLKNTDTSKNAFSVSNSSSLDNVSDASDTLDANLNATIYGINLGAGISVPVQGDNKNPVYSASITINPVNFLTSKTKSQTNLLTEEQELLTIQAAEEDYQTSVVDQQTSLSDIIWSKNTNFETYKMYDSLEKDMSAYLEAGVITESEYLNSFANKELYSIKLLINDIDLIIYNNTTKLLFCRDGEIQ